MLYVIEKANRLPFRYSVTLLLSYSIANAAHGFYKVGLGKGAELFADILDVYVDVVGVGIIFQLVAPQVFS